MDDNVGHLRYLGEDERQRLRDMVQVFLAEKTLEGCGGLALTDEIRVTIAASACLLLLGLDHDMYRRVDSILVYPTTVQPPARPMGFFELPTTPTPQNHPLLGEAHRGGPVILVWDAVRRGARNPRSGHNVVLHEFAHKLDMLDGSVDGTPPLRGSAQLQAWAAVCSTAFDTLRAQADAGERTFMDSYGAESEGEFFAVATEAFFERPHALLRDQPALYETLRAFYRQDPASRVPVPAQA